MPDSYQKVIAMDGPSGSGKSTMAKKLAAQLDFLYIDTGAMYRALGLTASEAAVPFEEGPAVDKFLQDINFNYVGKPDHQVEVNGKNLTELIRQHHVSGLASRFSQIPAVRDFLVEEQRRLVQSHYCVMEGRDIGTVVFPKAFLKIFITASLEVRSERRFKQLKEKGQDDVRLEQIIEDQRKRDKADTERETAPLLQAEDAVLLDTSLMDEEQVLAWLIKSTRARMDQLKLA
ncbi:MAG: (d)CMP kinase [Halobacteriovoraceae bacterium]|jgi:CMP/dCMP kinase|nr:(d)CMP kinase [Halobacteriovoraceae bacterium]MBT5092926.1 (d)CMP kinase [Halobacteriovoraceae bacterium]